MKMRDSDPHPSHSGVDFFDPALARRPRLALGGYKPAARVFTERKRMQQEIKVTIEGPVGSGKSGVALVLETALRAHGVSVEWVGGQQEKNGNHEEAIRDVLLRTAPRVKIHEQVQMERLPTLDERMAEVQRRLESRGMRDIKLTFRDGIHEVDLATLNDNVVKFLESYLDGHRKVVTRIEFDPESEPEPYGRRASNGT
jgi:nucleoside-triphosphatase THEP1